MASDTLTAKQRQALKLVSNLLIARKNGNVMREQAEWEKLYAWCQKNNYDFADVLDRGTRYLKINSIALTLGGVL